MVYIDPDVEIFPGFRNELVELSETNDVLFTEDVAHFIFYSKNKNNDFIKSISLVSTFVHIAKSRLILSIKSILPDR